MENAQSEHEASSSEEAPASYAFLNHSTNTLVNNLPPDVDNKPLARQKRKRTSPEDQAVLEAAYARDPKPDKEARLKLLEQIALGEKEVQIWFQNRRQTSRRKSRPLLPHEIAQFQMSRYGVADSDGIPDEQPSSDPASEGSPRTSPLGQVSPDLSKSSQIESRERPALADPPLASQQTPSSNDRSLPSLSQVLENLTNGQASSAPLIPGPPLRKSASHVRLSMTSEGVAKVVTKDSLTPSPPRPTPGTEGIVRAERDVSPSRQPSSQSNSLKRSASGRSRDSRAWEFWCDKDGRSELEEKAQKDGRGSAADAIGIIRAVSSRKALQPLSQKQNVSMARYQPRGKHSDAVRRPGLHRSQTSDGRLQHCGNVASFGYHKRKRLDRPAAIDSEESIRIPGNESDKENWSPGAEHVTLKHSSKTLSGNKIASPEDDKEVAAFMKGRSSRHARVDEELDCVQGLLSLSQGNWAS